MKELIERIKGMNKEELFDYTTTFIMDKIGGKLQYSSNELLMLELTLQQKHDEVA